MPKRVARSIKATLTDGELTIDRAGTDRDSGTIGPFEKSVLNVEAYDNPASHRRVALTRPAPRHVTNTLLPFRKNNYCPNSSLRPRCRSMKCSVLAGTSPNTYVLLSLSDEAHFVQQHIRELVRQSATHVMNAGGVVRNINSWGTRTLPQKMKRHGSSQTVGECVLSLIPAFRRAYTTQLLDNALRRKSTDTTFAQRYHATGPTRHPVERAQARRRG